MLFNSYVFIFLLLPISLLAWYLLNHFKKYDLAKAALILSSLVFYAYFHFSYLFILSGSIIVNYFIGLMLHSDFSQKTRKLIVVLGVLINLGVLGYFKYFDFFLENINFIFKTDISLLGIALPLGISFFTFQQVSYVVDCYKGTVPRYKFIDYAIFVSFFPQLVAGPIVLHSEMVPQFEDLSIKRFSAEKFSRGITAFSFGLAKKVLLADSLGIIVNYGFSNASSLSSLQAGISILAYTLQIYFDFSGYCDMASGIAGMFGMELPVNFDSPYKALNIVDFWKRWHKTLTRFFTQYVYIPLGGNRKGKVRTYVNIFIVFLVSGIWHGAGYTFIVWGILHGLANIFCRIFKKPLEKIPKAINWLMCFVFLNLTWVIFRADSLSQASTIFKRLFSGGTAISADLIKALNPNILYNLLSNLSIPNAPVVYMAILIIGCLILATLFKNTQQKVAEFKADIKTFVVVTVLLSVSILSLAGVSTFLYFDF